MKPNEKNYIFQQIAQRFKQHPRYWDELQTQQYLFFANLNFIAIQFQEKSMSLIKFLEEFENNTIDIIYTTVLQFDNKQLYRMKFNKWIIITIEYMMQQEETFGISMSQITSQTQYLNTFDDLQIIKEEKNIPLSQEALSYSQLQQDSRPLNPLFQRILSAINQDQINSSKHNSNIPEEKEDDFDDDSEQEEDEDENYDDNNEEDDNFQDSDQQKEQIIIEDQSNEELIRQNKASTQFLDQKQFNEQLVKQDLQYINQEEVFRTEEYNKGNNFKNEQNNQSFYEKQNQSNLQNVIVRKSTDLSTQLDNNKSNNLPKQFFQQNKDQQQEQIELEKQNNLKQQSSKCIEKIFNQISDGQAEKKYSIEVEDKQKDNEDLLKNKSEDRIRRNSKININKEQNEEIFSQIQQQSNSNKNKIKKGTPQSTDVGQNRGQYEEDSNRLSVKIIKKKSEDKTNSNIYEGSKSKNFSHHNRKVNRKIHIAKVDEEVEDLIVEEVQQVCQVLKDKQLIQWDKNELQNVTMKSKYFQDLTEVIEQNDIDGFMLFIIINEELQLHDIPRHLNISFSTATKLKSFIQILEPLRQEQMMNINRAKKQIRLTHQSSIEGDFVIESPELKTKNSNIFQSSNNKYIQSLIGIQQVPNFPQIGNTQKLNLSVFHGGNSLKTQIKFNTYDQLQDSQEGDDQKINGGNKQLKSINLVEKGSQMNFEIQSRDKLMSSTSDHDQQSLNFQASADQQQSNFKTSEDKYQSNHTIYCNDSLQWSYSKNRSPNYNKFAKTSFQSQNLSASQNKTILGLSQHFTSADNCSSYDEIGNSNSQPTLGTSYHFERQSQGINQNTAHAIEKIHDEDNNENPTISAFANVRKNSQNQTEINPNPNSFKNIKLFPSKSIQLQNFETNETQENQLEQEIQIIGDNSNNISLNQASKLLLKRNSNNQVNQLDSNNSRNSIKQITPNEQETNLGDSSYISRPLGYSQKVEKQINPIHNNNKHNEMNRSSKLRKQSSNGTLFQSEIIEQQQTQQQYLKTQQSGLTQNNLVISQQLSKNDNQQQNQQIYDQPNYFTQSDNIDQQIKTKGQVKVQLKLQQQSSNQTPQDDQTKNFMKQNNQSTSNNIIPITQNQNNSSSKNSYQDFQNEDQQQQLWLNNNQNSQQLNPENKRTSLQQNIQNQIDSNQNNNKIAFENKDNFQQAQDQNTYQMGNSIPQTNFPFRLSQTDQQISNQQLEVQNPLVQKQNQQMDAAQNHFKANISQFQQQNSSLEIQQQQIPYQQGSSFICYTMKPNYPNQFNEQNNQQINQNQSYVQGNSISFQQYPQQDFNYNNIQQKQNNFQGNSIAFNQPKLSQDQFENESNNQIQQQKNNYMQGASINFLAGQQLFNQQYVQQQPQFNNYGGSYNNPQQINIQQTYQNYNNYYPQQQNDVQFINNQYQYYQVPQQTQQGVAYNTNNETYYNQQYQPQFQDIYHQNNQQQYQQDDQSDNFALKLPNIFLMNMSQNNNTNDQVSHNQFDLSQNEHHEIINNQLDDNYQSVQQQESISKNIQAQKMQKLLAKNNQVQKCTYNLPFNPFKFDVIPTIKVDIKGKSSDQHLKYYTFYSEGATIGRNIVNSINFLDEQSISAFHAIIFYQKREFFIQDIKSKAGTFVKIKSIPITNDLKLKLGEVEIKFIKCENGIITYQTSSSSAKKGQIDLNSKSPPEFKLGRCKLRCDIVLQDTGNTVSYVHAQIHYDEQKQVCLTDLGSGNGTWVRLSEKSCRSNPYKLSLQDQIMISNTKKIVIMEMIP